MKGRYRKEGLYQHESYVFDRWGGVYVSTCIRQDRDGTVSSCLTDEHGKPYVQHLKVPEDEACDELYESMLTVKEYAEYMKSHGRPDTP